MPDKMSHSIMSMIGTYKHYVIYNQNKNNADSSNSSKSKNNDSNKYRLFLIIDICNNS